MPSAMNSRLRSTPMARSMPAEWHKRRENCRVVRFRPGEADDIGHLIRKRGGSWAFHYDIESDEEDDEAGYRFGDHAFKLGEYVSIREDEGLRTFRVVRVQPVARSSSPLATRTALSKPLPIAPELAIIGAH